MIKTLMKCIVISFAFMISTEHAIAQIDQSQIIYVNQDYVSKVREAEKLITDLMISEKIPGLSVAVASKNNIIWVQGFGFADLENQTPVKINSKFRIGSISKTLTALAIAKLIEKEQINLSDDVRKYVLYFPEKKYPFTVGQLATHTAGIRNYNYRNGEYLSDKNYNTVEESINIFKDDSLLFEPGTKFSYSSYGYVLLSAVVEGVTKIQFTKFMHDSILAPMDLKNTVPDYNYDIINNRVRFYDEVDGKTVNGYYVNNSNKWAGGGYLSTPLDLIKMSQNLLNNKLLKQLTTQLLWTPVTLSDGHKTNYGIGWRQDKDSLQRVYVHHGGSTIGGRTFLLLYPEKGLTIAIASNLSTNFDQTFVLKIAEIFIE